MKLKSAAIFTTLRHCSFGKCAS